ncbi:MAG: DUF1385 domain-containing protein [Armatimonadetes bacterium]|nr:DUF1385 domain-containing protein [Armatimonadota bacterium]MBS1701544.1 DUF1385 domain-containing protein [Armatimonadota bacterium]
MSKDEFLSVGGQAIVEGVMMRSPKYFAVACRAPNQELIVRAEPLEKTWIGRQKWLKTPFLRGTWALLDAMSLGTRAMKFASQVQLAPEYQPLDEKSVEKVEHELESQHPNEPVTKDEVVAKEVATAKKIQDGVVMVTMIISIVFALVAFKLLPQALGTFLREKQHWGDIPTNGTIEAIHAIFFLGYLIAIGQLEMVKEVFKYHGAEHKAINTWEAELPLTLENCKKQTRLHPRCGTSFAIIVIILEFFVFTFIPRINKGVFLTEALSNFLLHVAILPIIAGVAYELLRFAGKFRDNSLIMKLFLPGLWTQYITTSEPRDDQIEVALESLKACLAGEESLKESKA